jgi:hypothetical protein
MDIVWDCTIVGGSAVVQRLVADEYGLAVHKGRRHVDA